MKVAGNCFASSAQARDGCCFVHVKIWALSGLPLTAMRVCIMLVLQLVMDASFGDTLHD